MGRTWIDDFPKTLHGKHRILHSPRNSRMKLTVYRMLEITSCADMKLDAKTQYIIDSVPDDESSKSVLYGAVVIRKDFSIRGTEEQRQVNEDAAE